MTFRDMFVNFHNLWLVDPDATLFTVPRTGAFRASAEHS